MDEVQDIPVKKVIHRIEFIDILSHGIYVLQAIVHPDYNPNLYNNVINDIALIMLSKPANIAGKSL